MSTAPDILRHQAFRASWRWKVASAFIVLLSIGWQFVPVPIGPFERFEHTLKDALWRSTAQATPETRLVIVDLDEDSLQRIGPWPWPRATLADLVETLAGELGARAIGLDMVLPSPADPQGDARLQALSQFAPVVWGQVFDMLPREQPLISGSPTAGSGPWPGDWPQANGHLASHAGLAQARCSGHISSALDTDGTVRRLPLVVGWRHTQHLTLSLALLHCDPSTASAVPDLLRQAPGPVWELPFARQLSAYTVVPAAHVLQGDLDPALFKDRWVLVGASALGLNDTVPIPLHASVPGVMVHAQALSAWLDRLDQPSNPWPYLARTGAIAWSLLTLALLSYAMVRWRAWVLLPLVATFTALWLLGVAPALMPLHQPFSVGAPLLTYGAVLLLVPLAWWLTQRERRQLVQTFSTYVAPTVLDTLLRQGLGKPLIPRYADITVLSADMQNYTGLTAGDTLQATADLTRGFLQCITDPLLNHQGTLDKYTGDGLVAFWGAPLPEADAPNRAILAAIEMVQAVRHWNLERIRRGLPPARVRIGIDSGHALVGDLGTRLRSTYTAVGNCINHASKIQTAARHSPHDILVGETAAAAITAVPLSRVAELPWSEQHHPTVLYAPVGIPSSVPESTAAPQAQAAEPVETPTP